MRTLIDGLDSIQGVLNTKFNKMLNKTEFYLIHKSKAVKLSIDKNIDSLLSGYVGEYICVRGLKVESHEMIVTDFDVKGQNYFSSDANIYDDIDETTHIQGRIKKYGSVSYLDLIA